MPDERKFLEKILDFMSSTNYYRFVGTQKVR